MNLKSRFFKILSAIVLAALFLGYFAFSTWLFSPTESDFEYDVSALIPRDVDFYAARSGLDSAFDGFPRLAVMDAIEQTDAWKVFEDSAQYGDLNREHSIESSLADLETNLAQIPLGMEPQDIFGGGDIAVAGYFKGKTFAESDWAVYGRVNWAGKLGVEMLAFPDMIGLPDQGITATENKGVTQLQGGSLTRPLFLTRIQDIVIVGTSQALVSAAPLLSVTGGKDSFFLSARYNDYITQSRNRDPDDLEVSLDVRKMLESMQMRDEWPDTNSEEFVPAFVGRLFQAPSCKEITGVLGIDNGFSLRLHGEFSSEQINKKQGRFYRQLGFDADDVLSEAAKFAPDDVCMFVYIHGPIAELLQFVFESVEPALRKNLEDAFVSTGDYNNLEEVILEIAGSVKNRLVFFARKNDYPADPNGPPNDARPVFAVSLVTWMDSHNALDSLRDTIGVNGAKFGLEGHEKGSTGYFRKLEAGWDIREFWSQFVPGTGVVATLSAGEHSVISNSFRMTGDVMKTYAQGGGTYRRLADRPDFRELLDTALPSGNVLVWINPSEAISTLEEQAVQWANDNVVIDYSVLRPPEEAKQMNELFPGKTRAELTEDDIMLLGNSVDEVLRQQANRFREEQVPVLLKRKTNQFVYMRACRSFMAMLRLDPKKFEMTMRAVVPLD